MSKRLERTMAGRREVLDELKADVAILKKLAEAIGRVEELEAALASRPPAPAWTSEPPKVPGRYVSKRDDSSWITLDSVPDFLIEDMEGDWPPGFWYGPIPEPPEPTREEQP